MKTTFDLRGNVWVMMYQDTMNYGPLIIMNRLARDAARKVFFILDNLRVHHSKKATKWLEERRKQIAPPRSPELNLDEYLNGNLKKQGSLRDTDRKP